MKSTIPLKTYVEAYLSSLPPDADAAADADALAEAFETIKPLCSFVADASVSALERRKALEIVLPRVKDTTRHLAVVLANDGRLKNVSQLPALVRSAQAERTGKRHAVVTTAIPLAAADLRRLLRALERIAATSVTLEEQTDPSLLAGFRITLGDWSYDSSLKNKLDRLRQSITL